MKSTELSLTRFTLPGGFFAEVVVDGHNTSFWLGHEDYGIKEMMFATSSDLTPREKWEGLLEANCEEYMQDFTEAWMED